MRAIYRYSMFHCGVIITSLLLFNVHLIVADSDLGKDASREVNLCLNEQYFRCPAGYVISVVGVESGNRQDSLPTGSNGLIQTVSHICNGHQTCSDVGLSSLLATQCSRQEVTCTYQCIPGETAVCRSNVCAPGSHGLSCPAKTTIHIREVTCPQEDKDCQWDNYIMLATICEGSHRCDASGLRTLLSRHCHEKQVFVEYVCVPAKMVHDPCSKNRNRRLSVGGKFGIIRQPNKNRKSLCRWKIVSTNKGPVHFSVQLLTKPSVLKDRCDQSHMRFKYNDCRKPGNTTSNVRLCDSNTPSTHLDFVSCRPDIRMAVGSSNNFIISYRKFSNSKAGGFLSAGLPACIAPPSPTHNPTTLTVPSKPANVSQKALHDPASTDLGTAEDDPHSGSVKITLKLLLVYIMLGAVILILLAALITVLVRYYRMSLPKNKYGDSSENMTLWKRYDDTALDVFQNNMAEPMGPVTPQAVHRLDKVTATIHHEPPPEHDTLDNRVSAGSGFSSFLPPKRDSGFKDFLDSFQLNSFASYNTNGNHRSNAPNGNSRSVSKYDCYELPEHAPYEDIDRSAGVNDDDDDDDCDPFEGHYSHPNSLSRPPKPPSGDVGGEHQHNMAVHGDHQPLVTPNIRSKDNYHYCVNNDEYAVVMKPHKPVPANGGRYHHHNQYQHQYNHHQGPNQHQQQQLNQNQQYPNHNSLPSGRIFPNHHQNGVDDPRRPGDSQHTSGSFDKTNHNYNRGPPPTNSGYRKSREVMWRDEV